MPASVRDILLVIRSKEDASRNINNVAAAMRKAGAAAQAASLRAQAAAKRAAAMQLRQQSEVAAATARAANAQKRQAIAAIKDHAATQRAELKTEQARKRNRIEQLRSIGATNSVISSLKEQIRVIEQQRIAIADSASAQTRAIQAEIRATDASRAATVNASKEKIGALQNEARALDEQAHKVEYSRKRHLNLGHAMQNVARNTEMAGAAMIVAGGATLFGLKQAVDSAVAWDKQVRLTFTQVDKRFKPSLQELSAIGLRVARDIAVPFEAIQTALFDVFSSTEANLPQAEALLRSFSKAAVAGQTDITTASRATIGLMNSFKIPFKDVNKILDIQFQLVQEGVGTYEEWAQRIGLVTPSAVRAGQSIETMAAALATATRQGISSARAGTAVARAFDALSNPKTEKALERIGVKSRDAKGNFRPMVDILTDWRKELEKMPKEDRVENILDTLKGAGSTIEARRFLQGILLTNGGLELFQDQIKEFATDKGAFQRAYDEMANSVAAKTEILRNAWMTLKVSIGTALLPTFTMIVDKLQQVADWFNKLPESTKKNIAQWLLWGSILSIVAGVLTVVVGAIIGFAAIVAIAGAALAPMLASFAAVAAVTVAVIAGIIGLGVAFYTAYQQSLAFRLLVQSIGTFLQTLWATIVAGASQVGAVFQRYLGPPLQALWEVLQTKVIPAFREFIQWAQANLVPIISQAASMFSTVLAPALAFAGNIITTHIVPAIAQMVDWWNRNKTTILPVIKFLAMLAVGGAALAAVIVGVLIVAIVALTAGMIKMGQIVVSISKTAFNWMKMQINIGISAVKAIINWFKDLGKTISDWAGKAKGAITGAVNAIKGAFSGAASWLIGAGRDIIAGLVGGIKSKVAEAGKAAAQAASTAINAAKAALGIASPSKVFRDIGLNVIRGFVQGILGNRKKIQNAMFALRRDIMRSIADADISAAAKRKMRVKWTNTLNNAERTLLSLETKRAGLQTRLADATKSLNDQIERRNKLSDQIKESLSSLTDITTLDDAQKKSSTTMIQGLQARLVALKQFQTNLLRLKDRGFDVETIADIASKGVEGGGAIAAQLANASQADLNQISKIQTEIRQISGDMGSNISNALYRAGIEASKGLIAGLNSQIASITKTMQKIANALVAAIKKQLGIRSPSRVMGAVGVNTAQGYINEYLATMNAAKSRMAMASMFTPAGPVMGPYAPPPMNNATPTKTVNNTFNIKTQEIDPRKHAEELGWELQGRM